MTKEFADNLAKPYMETSETLCVLSDGGVYINSDVDYMKGVAKEKGFDIFIYKEKEKSEQKEEIKKEKKPKNI